MRFFSLILVLAFSQISFAQPCNYLAYEGFDYPTNTPLQGLQGGTGWLSPWNVQSENTTLPGYQIAAGSPLQWLDLQTAGNQASGGFAYLTSGRRINTNSDGPFAPWLTQDGTIGKPGTTLWTSILLRKNQQSDEQIAAVWHSDNIQWCDGCTSNKISVGYFGNPSNVNGQRRWSLQLGSTVYPSNVPMVPNETAFLVLKIEFSANNTLVSLYVNPSELGNGTPAPTLTQTTTFPLQIRSFALYLGDDAASGQADEIRMGASYACTAPDPNISVNQGPTASFSMTPPNGIAPLLVQLDGSASSDPDGSVVAYTWNFGDGSPEQTGQNVAHTFTATGVLTVRLTVTDNFGLQHSLSKSIEVFNPSGNYSCLLGLVNEKLASCTGNDGRFRVTNYDNIPLQLRNAAGAIIPPASQNLYDNLAPGQYTLTAQGSGACRDTFSVVIQRDSNTCPGWTPEPCAMKIGVGIEGLAYYSAGRPFKDFFKSCGQWITYDANPPGGNFVWNTENQAHIPVNSDGYALQVPFSVPNGSGQNLLRGIISALGFIPQNTPMRLLYEGVGTLQMQGAVTVTNSQPGQIDFIVLDDGNIFFNLTQSQVGNPVRNIRVIETSNAATYETEPFRAGFLEKCAPFHTLRFMDWMHTNGSRQTQWSGRTLPNYYSQAESPNGGLAYEYIIELANELDKDIWVCIPHQADDAYIAAMATLFRDGLEPGIQVYIEYSNEVWNWIFPQAHWVSDNGPQNISYPRRYVERSLHAFDVWMGVWGNQNARLKRVLGTQNGYDWITEEILAHADPQRYDYLSPSWYVGLNHGDSGVPNLQALGASATPEDVLENANNSFTAFYPRWEMVYRTTKLYGKKVINYEGGQHFTDFSIPPYIQSMYDAQVHPGMYALYERMLDSLRVLGSELPMAFVLTGPWKSQYGSWGHIFSDDDPAPWTDRPKFQVLLDEIAQCPEVPSGTRPTPTTHSIVTVFPNPTTGVFSLQIPEEWPNTPSRIRLYDTMGRLRLEQAMTVTPSVQIPQEWAQGFYYFEVLGSSGAVLGVGRVVKVGG